MVRLYVSFDISYSFISTIERMVVENLNENVDGFSFWCDEFEF
jgi:hypothetical protein